MKKLMLLLVPLALFAQVYVDTVIRFPGEVGNACFFPELNKLYVSGYPNGYFVLDCSTYQLRPNIPVPLTLGHWSYNWRRQKLYVTQSNSTDSTMVVDVAGDSELRWLGLFREFHTDVYLSDLDVRFKPAVDTLFEYECAADTVIRRWPIHSTCASWDSVGHKLYVGQGSYKKLYVYDYLADSCLKIIDVSAVQAIMPDACIFSRTHRRAYVSSFQGQLMGYPNLGIVDTKRDTLLRVLPVRLWKGLYDSQVAVNERDGKVYITDCDDMAHTPDTMWVVDCATDSVLKKFECVHAGRPRQCIRWVPWSNRIYFINIFPDATHLSSLVVVDCNTDSVIVPEMLLSDQYLYDIQLDTIHQRIFVTGGDTNTVYVLRDVQGGVVEEPASARPALAPGLQVQMTSGGYEVSYSIASPCYVDLSVSDLMGREIRQLVAGQQPAGEHCALWDYRDRNGTPVPRGVYFCRLVAGDASSAEPPAAAKVVVTR
ncbi:MAG: hypothetical protein E4G93_02630 [Dehalococcoidia bacterium]|nr:MAG: hypothetical protein E4G93_02630 [Dehalococcoidia bacterium]